MGKETVTNRFVGGIKVGEENILEIKVGNDFAKSNELVLEFSDSPNIVVNRF